MEAPLKRGVETDFTIIFANQRFEIHKRILFEQSEYFHYLQENKGFIESEKNFIEIDNIFGGILIDAEMMNIYIEWLYNNSFHLKPEFFDELHVLANYFGSIGLVNKIFVNAIALSRDSNESLGIVYLFLKKWGHEAFAAKAFEVIKKRLAEFLLTNEVYMLTEDQMLEFVKDFDNGCREDILLEGVMRWIAQKELNEGLEAPEKHLLMKKYLSYINFDYFSEEYKQNFELKHNFKISEIESQVPKDGHNEKKIHYRYKMPYSDESRILIVDDRITELNTDNFTQTLFQNINFRPKTYDVSSGIASDSLIVSGGYTKSNTISNLFAKFELEGPSPDGAINLVYFDRLKEMPSTRIGHRLIYLNGYMYAVGGFSLRNPEQTNYSTEDQNRDQTELRTMLRYSFFGETWTTLAPMQEIRDNPAVAMHDGYIYVFSGNDESKIHSTMERYDTNYNSWQTFDIDIILRPRSGIVCYKDVFYILSPSGKFYSVVPMTLQKTVLPEMPSRKFSNVWLVAKRDKIYAFDIIDYLYIYYIPFRMWTKTTFRFNGTNSEMKDLLNSSVHLFD